MTVEEEENGEKPRRKFDDVASLFGGIVPAPLAVSRPIIDYPAPLPRQEPPLSPVETPPVALEPPRPEPASAPEVKPVPTPNPRPRPTELPWPDAFEPRPNYRRREPRNWSWLLLIPAGFIAAVAITMLDPRAIRSWLDANVLHRTPLLATTEAPLLSPTPRDVAPLQAPAQLPAPAPSPAPVAEAPIQYPALPTSPVPVPPGTEVSPPPVDPTLPVPPAAPIRVTIQFRRNIPGADGEAHRIAALLQNHGGSIELHPNVSTVKAPTINYYNPGDKAAATALASVLSNEAANWVVRLGPTKYPPGTLDVWLP